MDFVCGALTHYNDKATRCSLDNRHVGDHANGTATWPNTHEGKCRMCKDTGSYISVFWHGRTACFCEKGL